MSLYLKYRPSDFSSIVWQEQVKDILKAQVNSWKIWHSYIFFWPRGTWKTSTARIFAKAINCLSDKDKPCNECENCKIINEWKTLDFVEIDAASNTQVDKIREEIIDKAIYPPTTLKKKVYIIDEVHMLSKSAFNALLKIMEEPPEYLVFILATTEIHKVPETIISRCEVFNFKRIPQEKIIERLKLICENENIPYKEEWLKLIAKISDWWLRDAIKYLEQVSIIWEINEENVSKFLGIAPERQIEEFIQVVKSSDINKIFQKLEELQQQWIDLSNFIKDILLYLNQHLLDNLNENLQLVNLFDEIYQNIKNYPSAILAYKTILWSNLTNLTNSPNLTNLTEEKTNNSKPDKKNPDNSLNTHQEDLQTPTKNTKTSSEKSSDISSKTSSDISSESSSDILTKQSSDSSSDNPPTSLQKEDLLKNISSPIVKWIIKNFWHLDFVDGKIVITIISQTNYKILTQPEKLEELQKAIDKLAPWTPFEVIYMSKEDFFNQKLLA